MIPLRKYQLMVMNRLDIISLNSVTEHSLKEPFAHCCGCCYKSHSPVVWSVSADPLSRFTLIEFVDMTLCRRPVKENH